YTDKALTLKASPILFDRAPDGRVLIPGRWCRRWIERFCESHRWLMENVVRRGEFDDCMLPATTDTVALELEDAYGTPLTWEFLPPGTLLTVRVRLPEREAGP